MADSHGQKKRWRSGGNINKKGGEMGKFEMTSNDGKAEAQTIKG